MDWEPGGGHRSLMEGEREGQAREGREAGSQPRLLLHPCPPRPGHTLAPEAPSGRAECSQGGQLYRKVHGFQSGSDISWATILRVYLTLAFTFLVCKMGKASRRALVRATQEKLCMVFTDVWPTGGLSNDSPLVMSVRGLSLAHLAWPMPPLAMPLLWAHQPPPPEALSSGGVSPSAFSASPPASLPRPFRLLKVPFS